MAFNHRFSGGTAGLWRGAFVGVEEERGFGLGMPSFGGKKGSDGGLGSQQEGSKAGAQRTRSFAEMAKGLKEKEDAGGWQKVGGGKGKAPSAAGKGTSSGAGGGKTGAAGGLRAGTADGKGTANLEKKGDVIVNGEGSAPGAAGATNGDLANGVMGLAVAPLLKKSISEFAATLCF